MKYKQRGLNRNQKAHIKASKVKRQLEAIMFSDEKFAMSLKQELTFVYLTNNLLLITAKN